jgi:hypothetical protein
MIFSILKFDFSIPKLANIISRVIDIMQFSFDGSSRLFGDKKINFNYGRPKSKISFEYLFCETDLYYKEKKILICNFPVKSWTVAHGATEFKLNRQE